MDDKEMLDYLEQMIREKPRFEIIFNQYDSKFLVRDYIQGQGDTLRDAITDYSRQREDVIENLKQYGVKSNG